MAVIKTNSVYRSGGDHFQPEAQLDAHEQRRLRGHLEQIDYAAYDADMRLIPKVIGEVGLSKIQALATSAARARAEWVQIALALGEVGRSPTSEELQHLAHRRAAFEEMREAYEGVRRMVERGYAVFNPAA